MRKLVPVVPFAALLVLSLLLPSAAAAQPAHRPGPGELAEKLVTEVTRIREGDLVRINGRMRDVELMEEIAVAVRRRGAFPLITLASDEMARRMYEEVPARFDGQSPAFELGLAGLVTVEINIDDNLNQTATLAGVAPARIATVDSAATSVNILKTARAVRDINIGNEIYPTSDLAERFGMSLAELEDLFWSAIAVDYRALERAGNALRARLTAGSTLEITHPNGTDFRVGISESLVFVGDGRISEREAELGGASRSVWLPAGEVYLVPDPGTAQGAIVVERQYFQGRLVEDLLLMFEEGRLIAMNASSGLAPLRARYEVAGLGRDQFAFIDFGINPEMRSPEGSHLLAWMAEGMVTVGIGGNTWAGGSNNSTFSLSSHLAGVTVKVDGETVVEDGRLRR